jgi:hypothetical protein
LELHLETILPGQCVLILVKDSPRRFKLFLQLGALSLWKGRTYLVAQMVRSRCQSQSSDGESTGTSFTF